MVVPQNEDYDPAILLSGYLPESFGSKHSKKYL